MIPTIRQGKKKIKMAASGFSPQLHFPHAPLITPLSLLITHFWALFNVSLTPIQVVISTIFSPQKIRVLPLYRYVTIFKQCQHPLRIAIRPRKLSPDKIVRKENYRNGLSLRSGMLILRYPRILSKSKGES